jgi:hypothetical protein
MKQKQMVKTFDQRQVISVQYKYFEIKFSSS